MKIVKKIITIIFQVVVGSILAFYVADFMVCFTPYVTMTVYVVVPLFSLFAVILVQGFFYGIRKVSIYGIIMGLFLSALGIFISELILPDEMIYFVYIPVIGSVIESQSHFLCQGDPFICFSPFVGTFCSVIGYNVINLMFHRKTATSLTLPV